MKRHFFIKAGLAIPALVAAVWFAHDFRSITMAPRERQPTSARPASPPPSPAGDFITGFHATASGKDCVRRDAGLAEIAGRWVGKNPREALEFARRLPAGEVRETFLRQLLVAWAEKDADAALSWSDQLENDAERLRSQATVCTELAKEKPRQALELAIGHGADEGIGDGLLENLTMQWADREPAPALEWVRQQPTGEWRDRLMARVVFVLAKSEPFNAACHVAEEMEPGPMQNEAIISVLHQWAMSDFPAARDWAETLPTGVLRERAMNELTGLRNSVRND
jgi:hypothetical protein